MDSTALSLRRTAALRDAGRGMDYWLLASVLTLVGIGIVMVYSSSSIYAAEKLGDGTYFLRRHVLAASLGVLLMMGASLVGERVWWTVSLPSLGVAVLALVLVLVPHLGRTTGGSSRWLRMGGISWQPAEVAKIALVLYLSYSIVRKGEKMSTFSKGFLPHAIVSGAIILLVLAQPDFGTAMVLFSLFMLMVYAAGVRFSHLVSLILLAVPLVYALIMRVDYRRRRVLAFLNPWTHAQDSAFQIVQSFIAFGSGGLLGQGLGKGRQKLFYLPEAHTDFIFSCIGEELGLLGVMLVVGLFSIVIWRGLRASVNARSEFGRYLALGCTLFIGVQGMVNMCVALGILPTKGLPLPFVSYGGTSLVVNLAAAGIVLGVARRGAPEAAAIARTPRRVALRRAGRTAWA